MVEPLAACAARSTDYAIWRVGRTEPAAEIQLEAHSLADHLLAAADLVALPDRRVGALHPAA